MMILIVYYPYVPTARIANGIPVQRDEQPFGF